MLFSAMQYPDRQPTATDAEIERVLEAMIPEIRTALKTVMQEHHPIDSFDCGSGLHKRTGVRVRYVCFIAHEFAAAILESTMQGIGASIKAQMDQLTALEKLQ